MSPFEKKQEHEQLSNNLDLAKLEKDIMTNTDKYKAEDGDDDLNQKRNVLDTDTVGNILYYYSNQTKISQEEALIIISKLIYKGGTNQSKSTIIAFVNGQTYSIKELRDTIRFVKRSATVRKLARSMRSIINSIGKINQWPGPLSKQIPRFLEANEKLQTEHLYLCGEWNLDEEDIPKYLQNALVARQRSIEEKEENRRMKSSQINKSKGKSGKQK